MHQHYLRLCGLYPINNMQKHTETFASAVYVQEQFYVSYSTFIKLAINTCITVRVWHFSGKFMR